MAEQLLDHLARCGVFEDFGAALTPELRAQEERIRAEAARNQKA